MSNAVDLIKEVKNLIEQYAPDNRVHIDNSSENKQDGEQWVNLKYLGIFPVQVMAGVRDFFYSVEIKYYHKNDPKSDYDYIGENLDLITTNLPMTNRPIWRYYEMGDISFDSDIEGYEMFSFPITFQMHELAVCSTASTTYITDDDGVMLISEDGYYIVED